MLIANPNEATYDQVCLVQAKKKRDDDDEDNATNCNDGLSFILDILSLLLCWPFSVRLGLRRFSLSPIHSSVFDEIQSSPCFDVFINQLSQIFLG